MIMNLKNTLVLSIIICLMVFPFASVTAQMEKGIKSDKLTLVWSTEKEFKVPESVYYDEKPDLLYIANINGKPTDKDGNGFISAMKTDGEIVNLEWVTGLDAPKGMGVYKDKLYVTDIDRLVEIDIKKGKITRDWVVSDAQFLNDIAVDAKGMVYVSDMMDTKVYRLKDDEFEVWLDNPELTSPNGLWAGESHLFIGCKKIMKADLMTGKLEFVIGDTGSIDGLESTGDGGFLYSDWTGNVHYVNPKGSIEHLLSTAGMEINAADIEYIPSMKMLLVPTFFDNRVAAYTFDEKK
jgi:hypothetical protein